MLKVSTIRILAYLYRYKDINRLYEKDFRKMTGMTLSTISRCLKDAENKGILNKVKESSRGYTYWLTDKGMIISKGCDEIERMT